MNTTTQSTATHSAPHIAGHTLALVVLIAATVGGVFLLLWQASATFDHSRNQYLLDLGVYRDAGRAIVDHAELYGDKFPSRSGFAFINPPLAAVLFVPLTWMQEQSMQMMWTWATFIAAWLTLVMASDRALEIAGYKKLRWFSPLIGLGALGYAAMFEPLQVHLMYGQINIFLIFFAAADLLGYTPRWIRGLGVGLAAGIKITPGAFALVFLVNRRWADLARTIATFLVTIIIGWCYRATDSRFFWTSEFFNDKRAGGPGYPPNQALTGLLTRAGMNPDTAQHVMVFGLLIIAAISAWATYRFSRARRPLTVLLLLILAISISAPIAVTHHWVGIIVAVVLLGSQILALLSGNKAGWDLFTMFGCAVLIAANISLGRLTDTNYQITANHHYQVFSENGPWSISSIGLETYLYGNLQGLMGIACFILLCVAAWRSPKKAAR